MSPPTWSLLILIVTISSATIDSGNSLISTVTSTRVLCCTISSGNTLSSPHFNNDDFSRHSGNCLRSVRSMSSSSSPLNYAKPHSIDDARGLSHRWRRTIPFVLFSSQSDVNDIFVDYTIDNGDDGEDGSYVNDYNDVTTNYDALFDTDKYVDDDYVIGNERFREDDSVASAVDDNKDDDYEALKESFNGLQGWSSNVDSDGNWVSDDAESSTFWSAFESDDLDDEENDDDDMNDSNDLDDVESKLDALQALAAEEIDFMDSDNELANKVREMIGWGFSAEDIEKALGVSIDGSNEMEDNKMLADYQEVVTPTDVVELNPDFDVTTVESHTTVEWDHERNEPVKQMSVYVDEVTCVGCTYCVGIAQSTFFLEEEHGRARVFQQWGDDDETIQIAIDTCPVDCIHYIPYEELKELEIERRDQVINFKARLVNAGSAGIVGQKIGDRAYTGVQKISSNLGFGAVDNSEVEKEDKRKEEERKRRRIMEELKKSVDL